MSVCLKTSLWAILSVGVPASPGAVEDASGDGVSAFANPELTVEQRRIVANGRLWRQHFVARQEESKEMRKSEKKWTTMQSWAVDVVFGETIAVDVGRVKVDASGEALGRRRESNCWLRWYAVVEDWYWEEVMMIWIEMKSKTNLWWLFVYI